MPTQGIHNFDYMCHTSQKPCRGEKQSMANLRSTPLGSVAVTLVSLTLAAYFCFSAIQGDYGILQRAEYVTEASILQENFEQIKKSILLLENKTLRLSESYLDLDLLDEQARNILGFIRPDEIVIHQK